jgi:hypothetical protein
MWQAVIRNRWCSAEHAGCQRAEQPGSKAMGSRHRAAKDAETFGAAWDDWRDALSNTDSTPAMLHARMSECETSLNRSGFDTYK